jgi:hypothetical protein
VEVSVASYEISLYQVLQGVMQTEIRLFYPGRLPLSLDSSFVHESVASCQKKAFLSERNLSDIPPESGKIRSNRLITLLSAVSPFFSFSRFLSVASLGLLNLIALRMKCLLSSRYSNRNRLYLKKPSFLTVKDAAWRYWLQFVAPLFDQSDIMLTVLKGSEEFVKQNRIEKKFDP